MFLNMGLEFFSKIEFANERKDDPAVKARMEKVAKGLIEKGMDPDSLILESFEDPDFFHALPAEISESDEKIAEFLDNSEKFFKVIHVERQKRWNGDASGLLGEEVNIAESTHADGRKRRAESGYRVNVEYLKTIGIDPSKVLFFRATQPSAEPKPEYYWTSDFFEAKEGLTVEIPAAQRETAIVLAASLEAINSNGGLIQDVNDDSGLAVRQIGTESFDQTLAISKIKRATGS